MLTSINHIWMCFSLFNLNEIHFEIFTHFLFKKSAEIIKCLLIDHFLKETLNISIVC